MRPPAGHGARLLLDDGRSVELRPVRRQDRAGIEGLVAGLSYAARAMRFGCARGALTQDEAAAMADPARERGAGLVAVAGSEAERVVALGRYERCPGAREAELAVIVADRWQGSGVGTVLVERLAEVARADGLDALWAYVRADNRRMLGVLRRLGCDVQAGRPGGEVVVRMPVGIDERREEEAVGRWADAAAASLLPLMRPRAIAVVGASREPSSVGGAIVAALESGGFTGPVHLVNRRGGKGVLPSLALAPPPVDLVVIAVPAAGVPGVARQAAGIGARALIIVSSGFAEAGPEGRGLEAEVMHLARVTGMRVVGPNCLGVLSRDAGGGYDATFAPVVPPPGPIALASQSGGVGLAVLEEIARRGLGVSGFVSLGNGADVGAEDLLAWWDHDPATRVALLYLEGLGQGRRLARVARHAARRIPVIALKAGRSSAGTRGAGSHTAALAAGEAPTEALFALAGIVRVDGLEELVDTGELIAAQPLPAGDRVAIVTNAGGPGIIAADACAALGLRVPELSGPLQRRLTELGVPAGAAANPVDLGASATPALLRDAGAAVVASGEADAVLCIVARVRGGDLDGLRAAGRAFADGRVTVAGCVLGGTAEPAGDGTGPVWHRFPEGAARALANAVRAGEAARRPRDPAARPAGVDPARARDVLERAEPGGWLAPEEVRALLAAYGLASVASTEVRSPAEAAAAQRAVGGPVALKAADPSPTHKTEVGAVVLGCASPEDAEDAYRRVDGALRAAGLGPLRVALVQPMAPEAAEVIAGTTSDPLFGPVVLCGSGGVEAELWGDRAVALAPVGPRTAAEMLDRLRGSRALDGWRGSPPSDRAALADAVLRLGWLAADQPLLAELDCNPVRAPLGGTALVLDARARRSEAAA